SLKRCWNGRTSRNANSTCVPGIASRFSSISSPHSWSRSRLRSGTPGFLREPRRLPAVLAGDLLLVGANQAAAADDLLATDVQPVDPVRRRQDEPGDRVRLRAPELEAVRPPDGDVRALPRRQLPDVVAAEHGCAAARPEPERLAHSHRGRAAAAAGDEQRLLDLEEEIAALVRGRAVDAEPDRRACV